MEERMPEYIVLVVDPTSGNVLLRYLVKDTELTVIQSWAANKTKDLAVGTIAIVIEKSSIINNREFHIKIVPKIEYKIMHS